MVRNARTTSKLKKKEARASAARLRPESARKGGRAKSDKELITRPRPAAAHDTPPPLRVTPRPDLTVPAVSIENVDWEDPHEPISPLQRWELLERSLHKRLEELGADPANARFEAREGRVSFYGADGVCLVEARAQVLGSWIAPIESSARLPEEDARGRLVMAWADPALANVGIARLEEMGDMLTLDRPTARELLLRAADVTCAEHVLLLAAPHGEHYLGIRSLRASALPVPATPGSPVATVLRGLTDLRRAISQRDEPTDVLRARFLNLGKTLITQSETTYRDSDWSSRVQRAGKVLVQLAARLVPPTFSAIAAGKLADEWLNQSVAVDLADAVRLLEDEWGAFA
jgi:hypothetical protein